MQKHLFCLVFMAMVGAVCPSEAFGQSEPVATPTPAPSRNYYMDNARPANQIKAAYPYDIPLRNAQGDTLNSASVFANNGKPTVVMFWLTTCGPCRMELKAINEKFEGWKQQADFNLYAVSTDWEKNYPAFVSRVQEAKWPFPAYHDLNREFHLIMPGALNGLPQVFVLDKAGNIAYHTRKYMPGDEDKLFEEIKKLAGI
jgi:cytochrome c biogenesis protein CcmG/thiol:disulfide interchange protein DsbE